MRVMKPKLMPPKARPQNHSLVSEAANNLYVRNKPNCDHSFTLKKSAY